MIQVPEMHFLCLRPDRAKVHGKCSLTHFKKEEIHSMKIISEMIHFWIPSVPLKRKKALLNWESFQKGKKQIKIVLLRHQLNSKILIINKTSMDGQMPKAPLIKDSLAPWLFLHKFQIHFLRNRKKWNKLEMVLSW